MIAACTCLIILVSTQRKQVLLYAKQMQQTFEMFLSQEENIDFKNKKKGNVNKKSITKNGVTITINQIAASDGQLMLIYTVKTKDAVKNYKKDTLNVRGLFSSKDDPGDEEGLISLFENEADAGSIQDSVYGGGNLKGNQSQPSDEVMFYESRSGTGFKYLNKKLTYTVTVYNQKKKTEFQFDVTIDKLNQLIEKNVDYHYKDGTYEIAIGKVAIDIGEVRVYAESKGVENSGYSLLLEDENQNKIDSNSVSGNNDNNEWIYSFMLPKESKHLKLVLVKKNKTIKSWNIN